jgi:hypothetical protein
METGTNPLLHMLRPNLIEWDAELHVEQGIRSSFHPLKRIS